MQVPHPQRCSLRVPQGQRRPGLRKTRDPARRKYCGLSQNCPSGVVPPCRTPVLAASERL